MKTPKKTSLLNALKVVGKIALGSSALGALNGCDLYLHKPEKIVYVDRYFDYTDVWGNSEFEADREYENDNFTDDGQLVTLCFGENILGFSEGDPYGFYLTTDGDINFQFIGVIHDIRYFLTSQVEYRGRLYFDQSGDFIHPRTNNGSRVDLKPRDIGYSNLSKRLKNFEKGVLYLQESIYNQIKGELEDTSKVRVFRGDMSNFLESIK